jgi:hypothetical protein
MLSPRNFYRMTEVIHVSSVSIGKCAYSLKTGNAYDFHTYIQLMILPFIVMKLGMHFDKKKGIDI